MKKINRVKKHSEFDSIIKNARYVKSQHFVVYFQPKDENLLRTGISVNKKHGNAVQRNRIKRQVRAMIDEICPVNLPVDLIIIVRLSYDSNKFAAEKGELKKLINKINGETNIEK